MNRFGIFSGLIACQFVVAASHSYAIPALLDGDYNGDGLVNADDAATWAATYGSTTELLADGNQNGIVDQTDYVIVYQNLGVTAFAAATDGVAAGTAGGGVNLIYDPNSGAVVLEPDDPSERINAFKLITTGSFNQSVASAPFQQFVADLNGGLPDGNTFVQTPSEIGQIDINGSGLPDDGANLGPILPAGLSVGDLESLLGGSQFFDSRGRQASFNFVQVPEPATLWGSLVLGGVVLAIGRRLTGRSARWA